MAAKNFPWRMRAGQVHQVLSVLQGRGLDSLYALLVHKWFPRSSFFYGGWGDLHTEWLNERQRKLAWPPPQVEVKWKNVEVGNYRGLEYKIMEGGFESPCSGLVYEHLPQESRIGRIKLLVPNQPWEQLSCVLHLPGTGDHSFKRRLRLGIGLLEHGIASLVLEGPFYGLRRPQWQKGSKLRQVGDLFILGRATIEESLSLLHWAERMQFKSLGVSGLSMGGVHACMVASFYPLDLACSPLLTPRSAAVAFCEGALQHGISNWRGLANTLDTRDRSSRFLDSGMELPFLSPSMRPDMKTQLYKQILESGPFYPDEFDSGGSDVLRIDAAVQAIEARRTLQYVLEAFTDVTMFARPKRPDAAVFVAARDDAYASADSTEELHKYWRGSKIRWVPGGHVSAYIFEMRTFCSAIKDSLTYLTGSNPMGMPCLDTARDTYG